MYLASCGAVPVEKRALKSHCGAWSGIVCVCGVQAVLLLVQEAERTSAAESPSSLHTFETTETTDLRVPYLTTP